MKNIDKQSSDRPTNQVRCLNCDYPSTFFQTKKILSTEKPFLIKPFFCNVPCLSTGSNSREIFFKKGLRGNLQIYLQFDCVCGYVRGELLQACVAAIHGVASTKQQTH